MSSGPVVIALGADFCFLSGLSSKCFLRLPRLRGGECGTPVTVGPPTASCCGCSTLPPDACSTGWCGSTCCCRRPSERCACSASCRHRCRTGCTSAPCHVGRSGRPRLFGWVHEPAESCCCCCCCCCCCKKWVTLVSTAVEKNPASCSSWYRRTWGASAGNLGAFLVDAGGPEAPTVSRMSDRRARQE
jgi:hypothetical protein